MGSKDTLGTYGRRPTKFERKTQQGTPEVRSASGFEHGRATAVQDSYDSLGELMASGQFRRLLVRADPFGGATWTLKAVLDLPEGDAAVYMHGSVKHTMDLPAVIEYCLAKGDWREDRHAKEG